MEAAIPLGVVIALVAVALAFDFMNGFHDAANSIATVVSTGVLKPHQAVLMAAFFNFVAVFVFHLSVASTVGKGIVERREGLFKDRQAVELVLAFEKETIVQRVVFDRDGRIAGLVFRPTSASLLPPGK